MYYLNSRYYDPYIGRFISIDAIEYLDIEIVNGLNLYAYCGNNPVMYSDLEGCLPRWMTLGNLVDTTSTIMQLLLNIAYIGSYFKVLNSIRPNNIGLGIWETGKANCLNSFTKDAKAFKKAGTILAVITTVAQVVSSGIDDLQKGYSTDRIISNVIVNTIIYSATTIGLAKLGGAIGSFIPIPIVGTAVGTATGYLIGSVINYLLELEIDDKTIINHIRDWFYDSWNYLFG